MFEQAELIHVYTDQDAIDDGQRFRLGAVNRVTVAALAEMRRLNPHAGSEDAEDTEAYLDFLAHEVRTLAPYARNCYRLGGVWKVNSVFRKRSNGRFWILPNELGGVTLMLPEDY